jgi:hypothetical protein
VVVTLLSRSRLSAVACYEWVYERRGSSDVTCDIGLAIPKVFDEMN